MQQIRQQGIDGVAPKECPPKDACPHEEIDEDGEQEIAEDGEKRNATEVISDEWGSEEGADERDGDELEHPSQAQ